MDEAQAYQKLRDKLDDQEWRLNHLYHIRDKNGQKVLLKFNWAQRAFYSAMWYFNTILKARQLGFSTFICIYFLDACLFNSNHRCGIIDAGIDDAKKKLKMIKFAYDNLPQWLRDVVPMTVRAAEVIEFGNGSGISVGTSHRGDTLQKLLVSEYGKVSAASPEKAREIKTGALNAVGAGQQIFVESTAEGKTGEFFDLCQTSRHLKDEGRKLSRLDPKFHFYAWFDNPEYELTEEETADVVISAELQEYFARFPHLVPEQKAWYAKKESIMGDDMRREFPSTPDEAFEGSQQGAFYTKEMQRVRQMKQITSLPYDPRYPVYTFFDIGQTRDMMSIWFYQRVNNQHRFIDYHESNADMTGDDGWDYYGKLFLSKSYLYKEHYMPHDGNKRIQAGKILTTKQIAEQVGIRPIMITERTNNVSDDIRNWCKPVLINCWFDETKCAKGIAHLDNYRRRWDKVNSMWLNDPQHDQASHGADAFRTFAVNSDRITDDRPQFVQRKTATRKGMR
jgi:hypothetical protein